jgi:hypothetical protein
MVQNSWSFGVVLEAEPISSCVAEGIQIKHHCTNPKGTQKHTSIGDNTALSMHSAYMSIHLLFSIFPSLTGLRAVRAVDPGSISVISNTSRYTKETHMIAKAGKRV